MNDAMLALQNCELTALANGRGTDRFAKFG
jgi:hypothetical protein